MSHVRGARVVVLPLIASIALVATSAPLTAGATAKPSGADQALLTAGTLVQGDLPPAGWVTQKQGKSAFDASRVPRVAACKRVKAAIESVVKSSVPRAQSPAFIDPAAVGQTTQALNSVLAFKDVRAATRFLDAYQAKGSDICEAHVSSDAITRRSDLQATAIVSALPDLGSSGVSAVGYSTDIVGHSAGTPFELFNDRVFVRVGRTVLTFLFLNRGQRFSQEASLIDKVVLRVTQAAPAPPST